MTEEKVLTASEAVDVEALRDELADIRAGVQNAVDELVRAWDRGNEAFKPVAHQLRVAGFKVKPMCPMYIDRVVRHAKNTAKGFRYPQK